MKCPYCDSDLEPGAKVCPACFADVASMSEAAGADAANAPESEYAVTQMLTSMPEHAAEEAYQVTTVGSNDVAPAVEAAPAAAAVQPTTQWQPQAQETAQQPYAQQPAAQPYAQQPYAQQAQQPYGQQAQQPYGQQNPYGTAPVNPYAQANAQQPPASSGGKSNKTRNIIIAIVAAVVIALAGTAGLAFAGVIDIPFISNLTSGGGSGSGSASAGAVDPDDPEAVYNDAVAKLKAAGAIDAEFDMNLDIDATSGKESQSISMFLEGDLSMTGIDPEDYSALEFEGSMSGELLGTKIALDYDYADGTLSYNMTKPQKDSGKQEIDPEELMSDSGVDETQGLFNSELVKSATIDGDVITIELDTDALMENEAFNAGLQSSLGTSANSLDMELGDWTMTIEITDRETGAMNISLVGNMSMTQNKVDMDMEVEMNFSVVPQ